LIFDVDAATGPP